MFCSVLFLVRSLSRPKTMALVLVLLCIPGLLALRTPSKTDYGFGARISRGASTVEDRVIGTAFQSRADVQSRVDVQPAVTASSRSSSEAPSKMNYSFGARLPRSGETYSQPRTDFQSRAEVQSRVEVQPAVTA